MRLYNITTHAHLTGDRKDGLTLSEAYEYASELVGEGHSPIIEETRSPVDFRNITWDTLHALYQGWDE